jgi:DNA-binding CsgD family transcriptional regulator
MFLESITGNQKATLEALSDRELQIANKLAEGLPPKKFLINLISIHRRSVLTKTGCLKSLKYDLYPN